MSESRRQFLGTAAALAVTCGAGPLYGFGSGTTTFATDARGEIGEARGAKRSTFGWDRALFESLVGSLFDVRQLGGAGTLRVLALVSVADLPTPARSTSDMPATPSTQVDAPATRGFLLSFLGLPDPALPQDTYEFRHGATGRFDMFIVPGASGHYTAVVNELSAS